MCGDVRKKKINTCGFAFLVEKKKNEVRKKGKCDTGKNWTRKYVVLNVTA